MLNLINAVVSLQRHKEMNNLEKELQEASGTEDRVKMKRRVRSVVFSSFFSHPCKKRRVTFACGFRLASPSILCTSSLKLLHGIMFVY